MISLELQQLSKSYGPKPVFGPIDLTHTHGILGVSGPNGSGKSTLLKCIGGLLMPSSGRVIWKRDASEISGPDVRFLAGFAAPYVSLYKELSVWENLEFLIRLRKMKTDTETLLQLIDRVGLSHVKEQPFGLLSTGQQQRAKLASSLLHDPAVLLLDEPGSNLDQKGHELIEELTDYYGSGSRLMILASNNDRELALCDRIFSIREEAYI